MRPKGKIISIKYFVLGRNKTGERWWLEEEVKKLATAKALYRDYKNENPNREVILTKQTTYSERIEVCRKVK